VTSTAGAVARRGGMLREMELLIGRKLDGLLHGDHQGVLPGPGTEAGDGRAYQPGDDVRRIDWNLTARSGEVHVRDTIAERELETWFVIDGSASLDYGTTESEKRDLAAAAVAAFGLLTERPGNRTGAVIYDGDHTTVVPAQAGRATLIGLLGRLEDRPRSEGGEPSLAAALRRLRHLGSRGGLVVVVSDLLDASDWPREMRALGQNHDVIVARLSDPREDELPAVGLLTLVDPETGRLHEVQTSSRRFRQRYAEAAAERRRSIDERLRSSRANHFELSTDADWLRSVVSFVTTRRRRR